MKNFIQKANEMPDSMVYLAKYTIGSAGISAPLWVQEISNWIEFLALIGGLLIVFTTLYINILKIRQMQKNEKEKDE